MVFTVELQETMRFGLWILGAAAVMLALSAVFFLLYRRLRHRLAVIDSGKGAEGDMSLAALNEAKERYLKELDKIEMSRQLDGVYRLDHAITATQKTILGAFGMTDANVKYRAEEIRKTLETSV